MTYGITCTGAGGSAFASTTVIVELPPPGILVSDFESGAQGWDGSGGWERSSEDTHSSMWAWNDSPGGSYANSSESTLWSPTMSLRAYSSVTLAFWHRHDLESNADFGEIWVDDGGVLTKIGEFTGVSAGWVEESLSLDPFAGRPSIRLGFRLVSDSDGGADGWIIDDVAVTGQESGTQFYALEPCRVLDTRDTSGAYGGAEIPPASDRFFTLTGRCGVPETARAIAASFAAVTPTMPGHLRLFPGDRERPGSSAVNFTAQTVRSNNGLLKLPMDGLGDIGVYNGSAGSSHLLIEVTGYFE